MWNNIEVDYIDSVKCMLKFSQITKNGGITADENGLK